MVDETTNIAAMCCPFHMPPPGQRKVFNSTENAVLNNPTETIKLSCAWALLEASWLRILEHLPHSFKVYHSHSFSQFLATSRVSLGIAAY